MVHAPHLLHVHCTYLVCTSVADCVFIIVPSRASGGSGPGAAPVTSDSSNSHITKSLPL